LITLDITEKANLIIVSEPQKNGGDVFVSLLRASNTKRVNLSWLPLEILRRGHTGQDYPCHLSIV